MVAWSAGTAVARLAAVGSNEGEDVAGRAGSAGALGVIVAGWLGFHIALKAASFSVRLGRGLCHGSHHAKPMDKNCGESLPGSQFTTTTGY